MEELYAKLRKMLDPQNISSKSKKLSNHLEAIKIIELMLYEEQDCNRFASLLASLCYRAVMNWPRFHKDCETSLLPNTQRNDWTIRDGCCRYLNSFPLNHSSEFTQSLRNTLSKVIDPNNAEDAKDGESTTPASENIFHADNAIAFSALKALKLCLKSYYYPTLNWKVDEEEYANDGNEITRKQDKASKSKYTERKTEQLSFIRPLVTQMMNSILPKFPLLIYRIDCMDLSIAAEFYEIPVLIFKYLFEINHDYCGVLKFEDCQDPIDYHTFAMDFLNELSNKFLCCTNIGYIHLLLDPIIKLIQINDDENKKPTKLQIEATDLVYKIINHSLRILHEVTTTYDPSQIKEDQNLDFYYDFILFEEVLIRLTDLIPFLFDNDNKCEIASKIIEKLKHMQNNETKMFIMLVCLKLDPIFKKFTKFEDGIMIDQPRGDNSKTDEQAFEYNSEFENIKLCFKITDLDSYTNFRYKDILNSSIYHFCERNYKIIELQGFPKFDSKIVEKLYSEIIIEINNERIAWIQEKKNLQAKDPKGSKPSISVPFTDLSIDEKIISYPCYTLSSGTSEKDSGLSYELIMKSADFSDFHH